MDAGELRAMQAPIKERYKGDPKAAVHHVQGQGHARRQQHRLQGRDRPRARGRRAASGDRRHRARTVLRRHAAGGAGRLRRRDAEGGRDRARYSAPVRQSIGRRRSRFPRHARRRQGRAGRLCADPAALRSRHDAPQEKLDQLLKLTERYCVVYQTIKSGRRSTCRCSASVAASDGGGGLWFAAREEKSGRTSDAHVPGLRLRRAAAMQRGADARAGGHGGAAQGAGGRRLPQRPASGRWLVRSWRREALEPRRPRHEAAGDARP